MHLPPRAAHTTTHVSPTEACEAVVRSSTGAGCGRCRANEPVLAAYVHGGAAIDAGLASCATVRDLPGQPRGTVAIMRAGEATLLAAAGRLGGALELAHESTHLAEALDLYAVGWRAFAIAAVHIARGDLDEALRVIADGIRPSGRRPARLPSTLRGWKAALLLEQGHHDDEARRVIEEAAAVTG